MRTIATAIFILTSTLLALAVQRPQPNPVGKWEASELIRPQELSVKIRDNGASKTADCFCRLCSNLPGSAHSWSGSGWSRVECSGPGDFKKCRCQRSEESRHCVTRRDN